MPESTGCRWGLGRATPLSARFLGHAAKRGATRERVSTWGPAALCLRLLWEPCDPRPLHLFASLQAIPPARSPPPPLGLSKFQPSVMLQLRFYLFSSPTPCPSVRVMWDLTMQLKPVFLPAGCAPRTVRVFLLQAALPRRPSPPCPLELRVGKEAAFDIKSVDCRARGWAWGPQLSMALGVLYLVLFCWLGS